MNADASTEVAASQGKALKSFFADADKQLDLTELEFMAAQLAKVQDQVQSEIAMASWGMSLKFVLKNWTVCLINDVVVLYPSLQCICAAFPILDKQ